MQQGPATLAVPGHPVAPLLLLPNRGVPVSGMPPLLAVQTLPAAAGFSPPVRSVAPLAKLRSVGVPAVQLVSPAGADATALVTYRIVQVPSPKRIATAPEGGAGGAGVGMTLRTSRTLALATPVARLAHTGSLSRLPSLVSI